MKMIEKTRQKFMIITLAAISLVLMLILGIVNAGVYGGIYFTAKDNIEQIRQRRGFVYSGDSHTVTDKDQIGKITNSSGKVSYMYVRINNNSAAQPFITTNMSDLYSADTIYYIAKTFSETGKTQGLSNNLMFEVTKDDLNTVVVIVDISNDMHLMRNLFVISLIIIILSLVFVFIFTYFFSQWAIGPVQAAFEKQKRFISDASHELKTPLTVISANADVLEADIGENKWLSNIKTQSAVMTELVHDLLDLTKLDETVDEMVLSEFDLSSLVLTKSLEFECTAFESGKIFEQNIVPDLKYYGNEDSITHLVTILIDNAIKHSDENGIVRVTLTTNGPHRILQVYNTGNGIKKDEKDKIFNRFYRSDESRSKATGGYGLGLSIAKSIVDAHDGFITVDGEENKWISFTVIL